MAAKKSAPLLDRHVEDLGDRLALVVHLEGLPVEPGALAHLARHVDVRQEVHLDLERAVAGARLAAPALDVEREAAGHVPAHLRLGRAGEQLADVVPDAGVGGRVRPRRPADRRLVDVHDLVQVLEPGDRPVAARHHPRAVQLVGQRRVEDVVDQAGLARAGHAGDPTKQPSGNVTSTPLRLCSRAPLTTSSRPGVGSRRSFGDLDRHAAGQVGPGQRALALHQVLELAADDDLAAVLPRPGADVDDPVGDLDRVLVVLDDDQRVPHVAQPDQRLDQPGVVPLVQPIDGSSRT